MECLGYSIDHKQLCDDERLGKMQASHTFSSAKRMLACSLSPTVSGSCGKTPPPYCTHRQGDSLKLRHGKGLKTVCIEACCTSDHFEEEEEEEQGGEEEEHEEKGFMKQELFHNPHLFKPFEMPE